MEREVGGIFEIQLGTLQSVHENRDYALKIFKLILQFPLNFTISWYF